MNNQYKTKYPAIRTEPIIIGFLRVSASNQVYGSQELDILKEANRLELSPVKWEVATLSNSKLKLDNIIEKLQENDIIIVSELSILGRSFSEFIDVAKKIVDKGIRLNILKENIEFNKKDSDNIFPDFFTLAIFPWLVRMEEKFIQRRTEEEEIADYIKEIDLSHLIKYKPID